MTWVSLTNFLAWSLLRNSCAHEKEDSDILASLYLVSVPFGSTSKVLIMRSRSFPLFLRPTVSVNVVVTKRYRYIGNRRYLNTLPIYENAFWLALPWLTIYATSRNRCTLKLLSWNRSSKQYRNKA